MVSKELVPLKKIVAPVILAGGFICLGAGTIYNGIQNARNAREIDALRQRIGTESSGNSDVRADVDELKTDVEELQQGQGQLQQGQNELNEKLAEQQENMKNTRAGLARVASVACNALDVGFRAHDVLVQGFGLPTELWGTIDVPTCIFDAVGDPDPIEPSSTPTPTPTPPGESNGY